MVRTCAKRSRSAIKTTVQGCFGARLLRRQRPEQPTIARAIRTRRCSTIDSSPKGVAPRSESRSMSSTWSTMADCSALDRNVTRTRIVTRSISHGHCHGGTGAVAPLLRSMYASTRGSTSDGICPFHVTVPATCSPSPGATPEAGAGYMPRRA
jgi:hypothetical protein